MFRYRCTGPVITLTAPYGVVGVPAPFTVGVLDSGVLAVVALAVLELFPVSGSGSLHVQQEARKIVYHRRGITGSARRPGARLVQPKSPFWKQV